MARPSESLDDLAWLLAKRFVTRGPECPREEIFEAFAKYHEVERVRRA
jgi:hypothetical protein